MPKTYKIEISSKTIIFTILFLLLIKLLWLARDLIFSLLIAFIIMSAVKPLVLYLESKKIPRRFSAAIIFILAAFSLGYLLFWIVPIIVIETTLLFKSLPATIESLNPTLSQYLNLNSFTQYLPNITNQAFNLIKNFFSNAVFLMSTIFFSFYFVIEENFIKTILMRFFGEEKARRVAALFERAEKRMNSWFWGELILMTVVGLLTFIGLSLIGVKYAVPLAIIAGLLEIVPNFGPTISTVPAFIVALGQSYFLGFSTIALYFIVQQLENNLIVPLVMKKAVGLNPIVTLTVLIIGGKIGGVLGVVLAIPTTLFIETILIEVIQTREI